jgi:predicted dehydrogenase
LAVGLIRFDTGAVLTIEASFAAHVERETWNVHLMGEKGGADWADARIYTDQNGCMMDLKPAYLAPNDFESVFALKIRHFVDVCRGDRPNESSGEHGLTVQKMLDAIYASADVGSEVPIV